MTKRAPVTMLAVIEPFLEINPRMPLRTLQALLQVAAHPGLTVSEHARKSGLSLSSMSRNLLDLGASHRSMENGYSLVKAHKHSDQREQRYYLTARGRVMIDKAMARIERDK